MAVVLDTGALIKGLVMEGAATTPEALEEAKSMSASLHAEALLSQGLGLASPSVESLAKVEAASRMTGDADALSATDKGLLALALDMDAPLVTDDYAVQNTAAKLGVKVRALEKDGIRDELVWGYRCTGCRRRFAEPLPDCPVCGAALKKYAKERKKAGI